ncbi:MAG: hypothetical protein ACJ736_43580 [Streptomyces sp.]
MRQTPELEKITPRRGAVLLALRYHGRELARLRRLTVPAMLLFAPGGIGRDGARGRPPPQFLP